MSKEIDGLSALTIFTSPGLPMRCFLEHEATLQFALFRNIFGTMNEEDALWDSM